MIRKISFAAIMLLCVASILPLAASETVVVSPDGVALDADGNPHYATFSLCAIDPETGESGVAVTTRVPFVGRAVPFVRAGVGAVATQAWTVVEYGPRGLDLLEEGIAPDEVLRRLLSDDQGRERRQLGIIDMKGRTASHTGSGTGAWAGSRQGTNYTIQGNILVGPEVIEAVAAHFESTGGTGMALAERMILALEAGQAEGGDKRWGLFQSAAIRIADPNDPGRGGDNISLSIDVGEHEEPVGEMKRIYYRTARKLGYRSFSEIRGNDVIELKRMLHALGYWRADSTGVPEPPEFDVDRELMTSDPKRYEELVAAWREKRNAWDGRYAVYDVETAEAVDAFREANELEFQGNPAGLVDQRFIEELRRQFYARDRD
ncbi:MAG TPA: DUF1028 domain-containing protein [Thermoanaerobaculia bacterium]|nr:DUF1028 domain-containing protein [Thermoanaerobaculia bacterium]